MSTLFAQRPDIDAAVADVARRAAGVVDKTAADGFRERWHALAELGVLSHNPGQRDLGPVTATVAAIEGIGRAGARPGLLYAMASQCFGLRFPLRALLSEVAWTDLGPVEAGGVLLCHALTEPGGGSDPLSMTTRAERREVGDYLLTGTKAYVTAAPVADIALVFARTDDGTHPFTLSPFLVDLTAPGVIRSEPFPKTAIVDAPMGALEFDRVRLAPHRMVGEEGGGLAVLATTTTWERALLLSYALGPMHRVLERTVEWASRRRQFGRTMGASHLVAGRVADMAMALLRCRRLIYAMAEQFDSGTPARALSADAALTKISVAEDYLAFTGNAATLGGARSFIEDSGLTADLADPMAAATYAGPNDLLRVSVARALGLPVQN